MAMMMARLYTGSFDIVALRNAYHGMSPSTMGLTAHSTWKYNVAQVSRSTSFCNPHYCAIVISVVINLCSIHKQNLCPFCSSLLV